MIEALIAGLGPLIAAVVELLTGDKPTTEETTKALRAAIAAGLPHPTIERAALAAIAAGNARASTLPPPPVDRAIVDLADRLVLTVPEIAGLPHLEAIEVLDVMSMRLREKAAQRIIDGDLGDR